MASAFPHKVDEPGVQPGGGRDDLRVCAACGAENPAWRRFCGRCDFAMDPPRTPGSGMVSWVRLRNKADGSDGGSRDPQAASNDKEALKAPVTAYGVARTRAMATAQRWRELIESRKAKRGQRLRALTGVVGAAPAWALHNRMAGLGLIVAIAGVTFVAADVGTLQPPSMFSPQHARPTAAGSPGSGAVPTSPPTPSLARLADQVSQKISARFGPQRATGGAHPAKPAAPPPLTRLADAISRRISALSAPHHAPGGSHPSGLAFPKLALPPSPRLADLLPRKTPTPIAPPQVTSAPPALEPLPEPAQTRPIETAAPPASPHASSHPHAVRPTVVHKPVRRITRTERHAPQLRVETPRRAVLRPHRRAHPKHEEPASPRTADGYSRSSPFRFKMHSGGTAVPVPNDTDDEGAVEVPY